MMPTIAQISRDGREEEMRVNNDTDHALKFFPSHSLLSLARREEIQNLRKF